MKKEPPDVMYIGDTPKESPLHKWYQLAIWAIRHDDNYLYLRAQEMIKQLKQK